MVYISPEIRSTTSRIDVKIKGWVTIKQIAVQEWTNLQEWLWEEYCEDPRSFYSCEFFLKYKYLEHVVGQAEASKHLTLYGDGDLCDHNNWMSYLNRLISKNIPLFENRRTAERSIF